MSVLFPSLIIIFLTLALPHQHNIVEAQITTINPTIITVTGWQDFIPLSGSLVVVANITNNSQTIDLIDIDGNILITQMDCGCI
jgi:hypothetical protein